MMQNAANPVRFNPNGDGHHTGFFKNKEAEERWLSEQDEILCRKLLRWIYGYGDRMPEQYRLFLCAGPHREFIPFGARGPRTSRRRKAFSCPITNIQ
jgi:hypothetical protein